ncbi:MAG: hypothetical protein AAF938_25610 [Myxococcota bacterium]
MHEPLNAVSIRPALAGSLGLLLGSAVVSTQYADSALTQLGDGAYFTQQTFGLAVAVALAIGAYIVARIRPTRLLLATDGLLRIRGVFGASRSLRPASTIATVTLTLQRITHRRVPISVYELAIDGSKGRELLCQIPNDELRRARALAERCAKRWGAALELPAKGSENSMVATQEAEELAEEEERTAPAEVARAAEHS